MRNRLLDYVKKTLKEKKTLSNEECVKFYDDIRDLVDTYPGLLDDEDDMAYTNNVEDIHDAKEFYHIPRHGDYEKLFHAFLERSGFDEGGYIVNEELANSTTLEYGFENNVFSLIPYYWGDDEDIMKLPNFKYKPSGLEIRWYNCPFRDAYCNCLIDVNGFYDMLAECEKSLDEIYGGTTRRVERPVTYDDFCLEIFENIKGETK